MKTVIENWQSEFDFQAEKYHRIGAWVAMTLNMLWFIGDYFEIPDHWQQFFYLRLTVSIITLITFLSYKKFNLKPHWLIFVPFLGIALQNAYMYSVMEAVQLQKHTFAYIALFIGAGMLILWKPIYSFIIVGLNLIANLILFPIFSPLNIDEILINGGMLTFTVTIFTILLIHTRYTLTKKEIISRLALEASKNEIEKQKEVIEHSHNEVKSSINYAERIQSALLAGDESWDKIGRDNFIYFKPRDVVSGDFYWGYANQELSIWAAADCTGHGVPGAFMSMLGVGLLNEIVAEGRIFEPAQILNRLRSKIIHSLEQKGEERKDGMDIAICTLNRKTNILQFSGAYNPLWIVRKSTLKQIEIEQLNKPKDLSFLTQNEYTLTEIKANKMPIGKFQKDDVSFTSYKVQLLKNDIIYTFSDGFQDQFGGPNDNKYMSKTLKKFLMNISYEKCENQKNILDKEFKRWIKSGTSNQIDDVCIIGVRI